nr:PREDICTED: facilitated trehalose transporter Tret1-like isoform X2 [Bemisia tabaci]XP_018896688.1 PREDICTED: facilitated trehalose transporter Tret1-like isoform X3 [Bemisia tabaci]XP_018896689.1 PREDICTED: facilitated trehalose transporter Tret1-like isoform X4 [Bemisia tabaci]
MGTQDVEKSGEHGSGVSGNRRKVNRFRSAAPQILAVTAKNLVLLDLGMTMAFSTIVVPVLLDPNNKDPNGLSFTEDQATWFASIPMVFQPLGSALSGLISAPLGRKRSLMLVNIPQIIGWLMLYSSSSVNIMYLAAAIQGLGAGFMDAPIFTYVGEICEPSLRGVLISYSLQFCSVGFFLQCLLGSLTTWRHVAFISMLFPTLAFLAISQIPETPMWLLSKNRMKEAEKALCWLRGWVSKEEVAEEFAQLVQYSKNSKYKSDDDKKKLQMDLISTAKQPCGGCTRPPIVPCDSNTGDDDYAKLKLHEKVKDLLRPEILKPMSIIIIVNFLYFTSGFPGFKTYMVLLFQRVHSPIDPNWASVFVSTSIILIHIAQMVAVKTIGKRWMTLISSFGAAVAGLAIGVHMSFQGFFDETFGDLSNWLLFTYFEILTLATVIGLGPVPWMLMSEIFPFRGRSFASGFCAAIYYAASFFAAKTYLSTLNLFGVAGTYYIFGTISALGLVYVYLYLPETEGLTLEEVEDIYRPKKRSEVKNL